MTQIKNFICIYSTKDELYVSEIFYTYKFI